MLKLICEAVDIGTATALDTCEGVSNRDPLHDADEFRVLGRIESSPAARQGFSSRRPLGGCERGGVWIIPTGRRKRIRTLFSRNTNSRRRDLTARWLKKKFAKKKFARAPAGAGEASLESGKPQGGALFFAGFGIPRPDPGTRRPAPPGSFFEGRRWPASSKGESVPYRAQPASPRHLAQLSSRSSTAVAADSPSQTDLMHW